MRHLNNNTQAVSVIVGALMLTLIAVTAATSFSLFVSQQQELRQQAEFASLQRELEEISIMQIQHPTYNLDKHLQSVGFILTNLHNDDSTITSFRINQNYIRRFILQRTTGTEEYWQVSAQTGRLRRGASLTSDPTGEEYLFYDNDNDKEYSIGDVVIDYDYDNNEIRANPQYGDKATDDIIYTEYHHPLIVSSQEQITITIHDILNDVYLTHKILNHNSITLQTYSKLNNDFSKTFYPPVALIQLDLTTTPQICDGTKSYSFSENAYIVEWEWTIQDPGIDPHPIYGPKIQYTFKNEQTYIINLKVTDNYGMVSNNRYTLQT
jgi:hypothetical protein